MLSTELIHHGSGPLRERSHNGPGQGCITVGQVR